MEFKILPIVVFVFIALDILIFVYCKDGSRQNLVEKDDSSPRLLFTIFSKGFWFLFQQGWSLWLCISAVFFAIYTLIIPFTGIGREGNDNRSFESKLSPLTDIILKSINPVDLTFGVMDIGEEHCRKRVVCQLRKMIAAMPMLQPLFDSYHSAVLDTENYRNALDAGEALEDCYRLFADCKNDPYEKLPNIMKV